MPAHFVSPDDIRTRFSHAMSEMYRTEVPQYGALLELVAEVNARTLHESPEALDAAEGDDALTRLDIERHGAIRLGTPQELATVRRLFAVMGMVPVGYYDLTPAGVPVHSTAFRPINEHSLARNPFRVFTSLLRLELIEDNALRTRASEILSKRQIFTPALFELLGLHDRQGGLDDEQATAFVLEALETFRWHSHATVDRATYDALHDAHRLIADVVCFKGPHINHLTPRTLDIDATQAGMPNHGITPKATIEGPPRRRCPILLRQTSFKALEEPILFHNADNGTQEGSHTARFGEIEQRGVALTPKGRALYDRLLNDAKSFTHGLSGEAYQQALQRAFADFPDDEATLRREGLAYYRYRLVEHAATRLPASDLPIDIEACIEALIERDIIATAPIIYEDFLPVSAAGIFQSNLGEGGGASYALKANQEAFEDALGARVTNEFALYEQISRGSLDHCLTALGVDIRK